jgi:hypothetical protein
MKEVPMADRDDETPIQIVPVDTKKADKPTKTTAERFVTWAKGLALLLPALGGLAFGLIGTWKGGDAQDAGDQMWVKLRDKVNEQSKVIHRLHLRMISFQARQEGETAATLQAKLLALQHLHDDLRAKLAAKTNGGHGAKLGALQRDLELEKIKRRRLEEKLKTAPSQKASKLPPPEIRQLPAAYRKGSK